MLTLSCWFYSWRILLSSKISLSMFSLLFSILEFRPSSISFSSFSIFYLFYSKRFNYWIISFFPYSYSCFILCSSFSKFNSFYFIFSHSLSTFFLSWLTYLFQSYTSLVHFLENSLSSSSCLSCFCTHFYYSQK